MRINRTSETNSVFKEIKNFASSFDVSQNGSLSTDSLEVREKSKQQAFENPTKLKKDLSLNLNSRTPVSLSQNLINPADTDSRYKLPEPGNIPMTRVSRDNAYISGLAWDKSISEFSANLGSGQELIENVARIIDWIDYEPNTLKDNAFRRPINELWEGSSTHGECSDIHNIGSYLLNQNGIEAYTVQMGITTGPHNVLIFKNEDGNFDIMEYGKLYDVNASSPEEAMRKMQNDQLGTVYKYVIYTPTDDGFKVRSIGQGRAAAVFDQISSTPNLDFNRFVGGKLNDTGIYAGSDGFQINAPNGYKATAQIRNGELQNIGIGKFSTAEDGSTKGLSLVYEKPTGMAVGQYQYFKDDYKWLSAGIMYHNPLGKLKWDNEAGEYTQTRIPTLVPFFGGSYGGEKDLVKNESLRLAINGFIQGRVALPLIITEEGREIIGDAQNGNVPWLSGGQMMGFSQLKTGTGADLEFSPWKLGKGEISLSLGYKAKYEIVDPTMIYRDPTAFLSNTGTASLEYSSPIGENLNIDAKVSGQITDSKFTYEQNRIDGNISIKNNGNKWGAGVSASVAETGYAVGANGFYMFNEKVGLMGGLGYDSTASRIYTDGAGFNVGIGTIYRF